MELENKKFRCHISIIFEECATFIASVFVLILLNVSDFFSDDTTADTDVLYGTLAIIGIILVILLFVLHQIFDICKQIVKIALRIASDIFVLCIDDACRQKKNFHAKFLRHHIFCHVVANHETLFCPEVKLF